MKDLEAREMRYPEQENIYRESRFVVAKQEEVVGEERIDSLGLVEPHYNMWDG